MIRKQFGFSYKEWQNVDELSQSDIQLVQAANQATENAYVPYSHFQVGAALLLDDGQLIKGSNQENASFPAGICAERNALGTFSSIAPKQKILAMAVSYKYPEGDESFIISPCGICRQVISEYEMRQQFAIKIFLCSPMHGSKILELENSDSLLPFAFKKQNLG